MADIECYAWNDLDAINISKFEKVEDAKEYLSGFNTINKIMAVGSSDIHKARVLIWGNDELRRRD